MEQAQPTTLSSRAGETFSRFARDVADKAAEFSEGPVRDAVERILAQGFGPDLSELIDKALEEGRDQGREEGCDDDCPFDAEIEPMGGLDEAALHEALSYARRGDTREALIWLGRVGEEFADIAAAFERHGLGNTGHSS